MSDPFTLLYTGLWDMLWSHGDLTRAVADTPSSRIKFVSDDAVDGIDPKFKTWVDQSTEADLPAVTLITTDTSFREYSSSSGISVSKAFSIALYVGTYNLNAHAHPLAWYILQAMDRYEDLLLTEWKGEKFIKSIALIAGQDEIQTSGEQEQVLPRGWVTVWQANALLWFTHSVLRGDN